MDTAMEVVELLLTADPARANELAAHLDELNRERQRVEAEVIDKILAECQEQAAVDQAAMVFSGTGWHLGVLGIVASRLVERFSRPVFVLSDAAAQADGSAPALSGSGRSIPAFHLLQALESMSGLFTRFGGHRQAAGVTLAASGVAEFRARFNAFASGCLTKEDLRPQYAVDAETGFDELTEDAVRELLALGPFGFGNPSPLLRVRDAQVSGPAKDLKDGKHFSVPLRSKNRTLFGKAWNFGDRADLFDIGNRLDLLLHVEDDPVSRKRGYTPWSLSIKDARRVPN
jgi:single-stranded-DNA-specific exonuclease